MRRLHGVALRLATQVQARTQQRAAETGHGSCLLGNTHGPNIAAVLTRCKQQCPSHTEACAEAAIAKGFTRLELRSTLPGVPFYAKLGFMEAESVVDMLPDGTAVGFVRMTRAAHFTGDWLS